MSENNAMAELPKGEREFNNSDIIRFYYEALLSCLRIDIEYDIYNAGFANGALIAFSGDDHAIIDVLVSSYNM
jgi:hypothetical protein